MISRDNSLLYESFKLLILYMIPSMKQDQMAPFIRVRSQVILTARGKDFSRGHLLLSQISQHEKYFPI